MKRVLELQKEIGSLSKNSKNPFFKSAYLDLTELLNAVHPLLHNKELLLIQPIVDNKVFSRIIDCKTNETLLSSCMELPNITDPQKLGSAITYYRRYTLKSLLAISEVDDDGNLASKQNIKPKIDNEKYNKALKGTSQQIRNVINKFDLTPIQIKGLEEAENQAILDESTKNN